jgi:hypothetical protein
MNCRLVVFGARSVNGIKRPQSNEKTRERSFSSLKTVQDGLKTVQDGLKPSSERPQS